MYRTLAAVAILSLAGSPLALAQQSPQAPATPSQNMPSSTSTPTENMPGQSAPSGTSSSMENAPSGSQSSAAHSASGRSHKMAHGSAHVSSKTTKEAQNELKSQGFYKGKVDGVMGRETKAALAAYQKDKGLPQTSRLDHKTLNSLHGASGSSTQSQ